MRVFLVFLLSLGFLFGVERPKLEDFVACYEKNKASVLTYEGLPAFALSENLLAVLKQENTKLNKYVKYDPFLNLYLVKTEFSLIPTRMIEEQNLTRNDWVGILDPSRAFIGHIKYLAQDINEKDQLDFTTKIGLLNSPCCNMLGIGLDNGAFIGNRYLKHFMKYNDVYWGDIGVDFAVRENKIYVNSVRKNGQFLINDEIVSVDGEIVKDLRKLNEKVLFADRGSTLYFGVIRDNFDLNISTLVTEKDLSRFNLPDNKPKPVPTGYRSNLGLHINKALVVTKVDANSKASSAGFMVGDKILRINNKVVTSTQNIQDILANGNDFNVLVERKREKLPLHGYGDSIGIYADKGDGKFQFFIRLNK
ncbi:PDZ domain-containing protein [Campylobacter sp. LR291e]|uniref:DUF7488 domain-containing protein n=1 Tax=unclassified Campylobacter TaxID=2593542 RepID=UPI0012397C8D|nr:MULTISPECIES: PDZ domain-containing protein [unclassified Campylobacter]KAA6228233.1 PDZ domain-containing protein [Campylobacter sp. LR196d]KAA6229233.1 PDZ domain-containing protein [Campylobacter sp. LR291e]KAA6231038.1 PDZ domain-containing protein [Campylobacter sp. LR264d]